MSETGKVQKSEMEETPHEGNGALVREDEADVKGLLKNVLNAIAGKKNTPVESSTSRPLTPSDKGGENPGYSGSDQHAEEYNMLHKRRGVALVFNHLVINKEKPRYGTNKDCEDLKKELKEHGFDVRICHDYKASEIKTKLEETSKEDHSDADCLAVFVMSHGKSGYVSARDTPYSEEVLWRYFTGQHCHSLRGKPKLFFIQACRGTRLDAGVRVVYDCKDSSPTTYTIPTEADILVAYSTVEEYYAFRSPTNGSWYIQALCKELRFNGQTRDLLAILTFVNRRVAIEYKSNTPNDEQKNNKVQMPTFSSKLTRLVYFRKKTSESIGKRKNVNALPPAKH